MNLKRQISTFALASILLLAGCKKDDYVAVVGVCPIVTATNPQNTATYVALNQVVTATFNEKMNPASITQSSFTLQGATKVAGTLVYDDASASIRFTPAALLTANTTYTGTVSYGVKDMMDNFLQTNYIWTFSTGATLSPMVVITDPANAETNVVLNKIVTATFNMPMDPLTINATTFSLKQGANPVAGTITYSGTTATFTPAANFIANTLYTGTITTGAKNVAGTAIQTNYVWSFTTGSTLAPMVISTDPANNETGVAVNKIITATFSMPMNAGTFNTTTFNIRAGAAIIPGSVSYSGTTATFTPSGNLAQGTVYTATITTGAKSASGTSMASNYTWIFTTISASSPTVISTDPANNATGVPLNKTISADFNTPMDPTSINASSFTLKQGATTISGTITYSGSTAFFKPSANLVSNLVYTATITTTAKNLAGTPMAANYVWSFTTGNLLAPVVIATDPANNATGVPTNKIVFATFNMVMDPLTINAATFTLKAGAVSVAGTISYSGSTASFTPTLPLLSNTIYSASITSGAKNPAGTPLANNYNWTFSTASVLAPTVISTDPANNATNVALNKIVTANFNMPMDPLTITGSTFTLNTGSTPVAGVVSYNLLTASFTPSANLLTGTTYTATITTGAKNLAGVPIASNYVWIFTTIPTPPSYAPVLNSVARFGIISGVGVTNPAGPSKIINLDVGIYPGGRSSITGFPPATVVNGAIYASDDVAPPGVAAMLKQAKLDLVAAYNYAAGATSPAPATVSGDQGGKTLAPGIYKTTSTLLIQNGDLTLDAKGDPNAVWIFQVAAGFTTIGGAGGNVILSGGAQAANVYWQVGSSATIGDYTIFMGNVLALTSITMGSHSNAVGRMLAINAAVTMTSTNTITKP